jgi:hypothetical protein
MVSAAEDDRFRRRSELFDDRLDLRGGFLRKPAAVNTARLASEFRGVRSDAAAYGCDVGI